LAYIPNTATDQREMLDIIGVGSIDDLFAPIPLELQLKSELDIPSAYDQISLTKHYQRLARKNAGADEYPCFLGAGVYDHYVPPTVGAIISRGEFLTSYTPYQPEVSQGVLQSIYEFQTLVSELFAMDLANASMYDAASGLAEAAAMAADITGRQQIIAPKTIHPAYLEVLKTYLRHGDYELTLLPSPSGIIDTSELADALSDKTAAVLMQHPNFFGNLEDAHKISAMTHGSGALLVASVDPVSLGLLSPPGDYDADIVVGEGQALGCPMGFGGPMLGLFACKQKFIRRLPGRIVGATKDIEGKKAYVMTLRTREQDIRREKATSNICTNVALYALAAGVHLATLGKNGVRDVANLCFQKAHYMANSIAAVSGYALGFPKATFFKEFVITCPIPAQTVNAALLVEGILGGYVLDSHRLLIAVTEQRTKAEIDSFVAVLQTLPTDKT
jgi:glycine dehydrogenase subunit 1